MAAYNFGQRRSEHIGIVAADNQTGTDEVVFGADSGDGIVQSPRAELVQSGELAINRRQAKVLRNIYSQIARRSLIVPAHIPDAHIQHGCGSNGIGVPDSNLLGCICFRRNGVSVELTVAIDIRGKIPGNKLGEPSKQPLAIGKIVVYAEIT